MIQIKNSALTVVMAAALVACGGGGSASSSASSSAQSPAAVTQSAGDAAITGHLQRLNEVRAAMGLQTLQWNAALGVAATKHANYQTLNQVLGHSETPGAPGYSGDGVGSRVVAAGYTASLDAEVIIGGVPSTVSDGRNLMDAMLSAPGHRVLLLAYEFSEVGMGPAPLTTNLGTQTARKLPVDPVLAYPYEGQTLVPTGYAPASEVPNPLPGVAITGYPLSLHTGMFNNFSVTSVSLVNTQTGAEQPLYGTDNLGLSRSAFVFFPRDTLATNTSYTFSANLSINGRTKQVTTHFSTASY